MTQSPAPRHVAQMTRTFVEGSFLTVVAVVSAITAATLVYVWFIM